MKLTLADFAGDEFRKLALPEDHCPCGKKIFASKHDARQFLKGKTHTQMRAYRCEFGDHYHLGHRRGNHS